MAAAENSTSRSDLLHAIATGDLATVTSIFETTHIPFEMTFVREAVRCDNVEIVDYLFEQANRARGSIADPIILDRILDMSVQSSSGKVVEYALRELGSHSQLSIDDLCRHASYRKYPANEVVKILIEKGSANPTSALEGACFSGDIDFLKYLLGKGANLSVPRLGTLMAAISSRKLEMVKFLISYHRVDMCIDVNNAELFTYMMRATDDIRDYLLSCEIELDPPLIYDDILEPAREGLSGIVAYMVLTRQGSANRALAGVMTTHHDGLIEDLLQFGADAELLSASQRELFCDSD